jgi:hypothetical protein
VQKHVGTNLERVPSSKIDTSTVASNVVALGTIASATRPGDNVGADLDCEEGRRNERESETHYSGSSKTWCVLRLPFNGCWIYSHRSSHANT